DETPRQLPPFPGPGASGPSMLARGPGADGDTRPPALKPAAQPARKDESLIATTPINVGPSRVAAVPRIVCVSTNYAGKEFALTRPELIIGRVEDNDIVIEHRSVSRNHAKIVFDGRAHKIIDLQSANGILVNGEEYAMTDLRKGDLIELGHVRFRFVPAGEAFVPTEDEIREMKEAGVQLPAGAPEPALMARTVESSPPPAAQMQASLHAPSTPPAKSAGLSAPSRPHDAPDVSHFDPSTAATVTDTPLSALSIGQMLTPQIEPSQPERSATPARKPAADAAHDRAPDKDRGRSDTAQPRSHDQRATEVNVAARANGAMSSPSPRAPTDVTAVPRASIVDTEERLAAPKSKTGLVVGLVAGIVILVGAAVFLLSSSGPDGAADRELAEQFKAGNFKGVLEHCQKNQGNYRDAQGALKLCVDAAAQLATQPKTEAKPEPKNEPEALPSGDAPKPETGAAAAKAEPTEAEIRAAEAVPEPPPGDADEPAPTEDAKTKAAAAATQKKAATKTNDRGAKAPDKIAKAKDLHDRAWRQWTNGDASKAIELLGQCITVANLPKCHRTLGSVYAQIGDTQKALEHYRRYLALDPTAPDVNRVKDIIREAEAQQ
ncbi:FHA domain-containing protein, partial [Myxococcota bacterium]|nr:FHA domain-containing protein [Myxococcota bacterium]